MAFLRRTTHAATLPPVPAHRPRIPWRHRVPWRHRIAWHPRIAWQTLAALLLALPAALPAAAQGTDGSATVEGRSAFLTIGGENTQLPAYADNALGFDSGLSFQKNPLLGVEFHASAYPVHAEYVQIPFTGGYRAVGRSLFGFPYNPYVYAGGGIARSQDRGARRLPGYPPHWYACWQVDVGFDRTYHRYGWRVAQASWRETSTPLHSLRSLSLSTGIVYHFAH